VVDRKPQLDSEQALLEAADGAQVTVKLMHVRHYIQIRLGNQLTLV
jgi:hypothetical protein